MLRAAAPDIFPFMNRQYPSATHMTSVQTMAVELATEVWFNDSNHAVKCSARNTPLAPHSKTVLLSVSISSRLQSFRPKTTGVIRATVQSRR